MGIFSLFKNGKRRGLGDADASFWSFFGSASNHAEEPVNAQTVMQIGAAYSCARVISQTLGALPFGMQETLEGGASRRAIDHNLHGLFAFAPNADQDPISFVETLALHILLRGNVFCKKLYSTQGDLIGFDILPPWPETKWRRDGVTRTCVVISGPHKGDHAENDIVFIRGFGEDRDCGLSVIQYGTHVFGRQMSMEKHSSTMLKKGARPNVIMTAPDILRPEQREQAKKNIIEPYLGSENAGSVMLLEGGFEAKPITLSPADAQLLEQMEFGVEEVCRWFGVFPSMIGHTSKQTSWGTGLEHNFIAFVRLCLLPLAKRITQGFGRQCQPRDEWGRFRPHINLDALMEGDSAARATFLKIMVTAGIYSVNEARAKEGLPPVEGGDTPRMQQQMVSITANDGGGENV